MITYQQRVMTIFKVRPQMTVSLLLLVMMFLMAERVMMRLTAGLETTQLSLAG